MSAKYSSRQVGVALHNLKRASLYFDYVIPVYHGGDIESPDTYSEKYDLGCPAALLPPNLTWRDELERCHQQRRLQELGRHFSDLSPYILGRIPPAEHSKSRGRSRQLTRLGGSSQAPGSSRVSIHDKVMAKAVHKLLIDIRAKGFTAVPVLDDDWLSVNQPTGYEVISLTSTNAIDIDTRRLSWEAIEEFRKDVESRNRLRDYRLFWAEKYVNKDRHFVADDLSRRYEQFQRTCSKHGFITCKAGLTALVNSKSLLAGSALALTAAIVGSPLAIPELLAGGAITLELANISLEIAKSRLNHSAYVEQNELAYLHRIDRKLRDDL